MKELMMKSMKKSIAMAVVICLLATQFLGVNVYGAITNADLPKEKAVTKWEIKLGTGYSAAPTPPLLQGDYLYVGAGNKLYKINKNTGSIVMSSAKLAGDMGYAMMSPAYGSNMVFISVGNGSIQALDANTLAIKWTSSPRTGATNSPMVFDQSTGKLYTGTWNNSKGGGEYICLDASTGRVEWTLSDPNGFYWAGAYVSNNYLIFGSEQGYSSGQSTIYSVKKSTGEVISTVNASGNIRSTIVGDGSNVYALTQNGKIYKVAVNSSGELGSVSQGTFVGSATGKPTMSSDRKTLYFGTLSNRILAFDLTTLTQTSAITTKGFPQSEMLVKENSNGVVDIYSTYNSEPGGICHATINGETTTIDNNYFIPTNKQFCTSPLICDSNGTIYYKNDSGYVMAVDSPEKVNGPKPSAKSSAYNKLKVSWPRMNDAVSYEVYRSTKSSTGFQKIKTFASSTSSFTDTNLKTGKNYYYKIVAGFTDKNGKSVKSKQSAAGYAKPLLSKPSIKTKKGNKQVKVSWKKVAGASGYDVYRATKKTGKYKKVKTVNKASTKSWTNKKLATKKTYYFKVKAYRKVDGKKVYSDFSKVSSKKL